MDIRSDTRLPLAGKREATKAQNRAVILTAARRVFLEMGYGAATVRDIIGATNLASGTFYNYFKSKEEVFQAIRDESALAIRPVLREARRNAATAEEFIGGTFRTFFEFVAKERADEKGAVQKGEGGGNGFPRMRIDTPEVVAGFAELREDIEAAVAKGVLPALDAGYLAAAIVGVAFEIAEEMLTRDPADVEGAVTFATHTTLRGIGVCAPAAAPS